VALIVSQHQEVGCYLASLPHLIPSLVTA